MNWMDRGDIVLLVFAAYVAVMSLVRLMARHRAQLVVDVERQIKAQRKRMKQQPRSKGEKSDRDAA